MEYQLCQTERESVDKAQIERNERGMLYIELFDLTGDLVYHL